MFSEMNEIAANDAAIEGLAQHYYELGFPPGRAEEMAQAVAQLPERLEEF